MGKTRTTKQRTTTAATSWVGAYELADHLGVGTNTVCRELAAGRLPHIRVGRQYRFNVDEVVAAYRDTPGGDREERAGPPARDRPRPPASATR